MSTVGGGGKIITDGLVLCLDAANPKSIISGNTTWGDLTTNFNNATLINEPTYSSENNGCIIFDGSNDYGITNKSIIPSTGAFSVCLGFSLTNNFGRGGIFDRRTIGSFNGLSFGQGSAVGGVADWYCDIITNSTTSIRTTWSYPILNLPYYDCVIFNGTNTLTNYRNGNLISNVVGSTQGNLDTDGMRTFLIANRDNSAYMPMKIFFLQIYNRALSANEVLQNYNATKSRFGL